MKTIPIITVDLDLPAEERWADVPKSLQQAGLRLVRKMKKDDPTKGVAGHMLRLVTKAVNPYRDDIKAWATLLNTGMGDVVAANFTYELVMAAHAAGDRRESAAEKAKSTWKKIKKATGLGCTSGAGWSREEGMIHLRTLDWPLAGLGKSIVVFHMINAPAGDYYNIAFPGFVGVLTGFAPGRFSASINYATPDSLPSLGWPPSHLMRHVFEECGSYSEALQTLNGTLTGCPALITLVGTKRNEAAIIECSGKRNRVFSMTKSQPIAISNDYLSGDLRKARNDLGPKAVLPNETAPEQEIFAPDRRNSMLKRLKASPLTSAKSAQKVINSHPIRNTETKIQVTMAPRSGSLVVYGMEDRQRVSELLLPSNRSKGRK